MICGDCTGTIAGKPAPTGFGFAANLAGNSDLCGSWLASDSYFSSIKIPV